MNMRNLLAYIAYPSYYRIGQSTNNVGLCVFRRHLLHRRGLRLCLIRNYYVRH